jgi:hypothetical protein
MKTTLSAANAGFSGRPSASEAKIATLEMEAQNRSEYPIFSSLLA